MRQSSAAEFKTLKECPKYPAFKYWLKKLTRHEKSLKAREGIRKFNLKHRGVTGSSTIMADGPGALCQVDSTVVDVWLVNSFMRWMLIGRPILYVVIDVFTRMVVGLHLALEGPNWLGLSQALANAMMDKVEFCARYGITIKPEQWPAHHAFREMSGDHGGDIICEASDQIASCIGTKVSNVGWQRADWKGIVERKFKIANDERVHFLPGAVRQREIDRGERDYRLDAKLTLFECFKILIIETIKYNNHHFMDYYPRDEFMIQHDVKPIPNMLWPWGVNHRSGLLREMDPIQIMLGLMPHGKATVTRRGIRYEEMYYSSDFIEKNGWFVRATEEGSWKIKAAQDSRRIETIYLIMPDGKTFHTCELLEREKKYRGHFLEEILDLHEWEKMTSDEQKEEEFHGIAECDAMVDHVISEATEKTNASIPKGMSKTKRLQGVRPSRAEEKERHRQEDAWDLSGTTRNKQQKKLARQKELDALNSDEDFWQKTVEARRRKDLEVIKDSLSKEGTSEKD